MLVDDPGDGIVPADQEDGRVGSPIVLDAHDQNKPVDKLNKPTIIIDKEPLSTTMVKQLRRSGTSAPAIFYTRIYSIKLLFIIFRVRGLLLQYWINRQNAYPPIIIP
jgi:hypothetical protein